MLALNQIEKSYHSRIIIRPSTLTLNGGIWWVKGVNGCGKTTLLKMIAGLLNFQGDILYNDISQKKSPVAYRQKVSWGEAEPLFPSFITGADLVALYRKIRKVEQSQIDEIENRLRLKDFLNDNIGSYSAGMVKRLSLMLAFMGHVEVCILDEPLITLDQESFETVSDYIIERHKRDGTLFLFSSHQDIHEKLTQSSKQIHINDQGITPEQ